MKLKQVIEAKGGAPGNTAAGRAWALKALHPADPIVEVSGIPDEDAMSTVFQNYQFSVNVANPTPATSGTWEFDLFFLPNPIIVAGLRTKDSAGNYLWSPILNDQIGAAGSSYIVKKTTFMSQVERHRIAYMSATGHHDCAAVTNQGMVAVAQYPLASHSGSSNIAPVMHNFDVYSEIPKTWAQMQTMPNSYLGTAKDGVYAVYKLSETSQDWVYSRDTRCLVAYGAGGGMFDSASIAYPAAATSMTTVSGGYPYGIPGIYTGIGDVRDGVVLQRADSNVMHIAGRNLHYQAQFTFMIRIGYELQVNAGSPLTTFARMSPQHDPVALTGYYAIAREMKDGYPEEYNTLGTLLPLIAGIAKQVLPIVLPGVAGLFTKFFGPAPTQAGEKRMEAAPAAEKERARDQLRVTAARGDGSGTSAKAKPRKTKRKQ